MHRCRRRGCGLTAEQPAPRRSVRRFGARRPLLAAAFVFGVAAAGCDEGSDTPSPSPTAPAPAPVPTAPAPVRCTEEGRVLDFGFFAFYEPISYRGDPDPTSSAFGEHLGYEADLLSALEAMDGAGLSFSRAPIAPWDGIWLRAATPEYDVIGGGITILDSRRRDASGAEVVTFTSGHVGFRQSLIARAAEAARYDGYGSVTSADRIGAEPSSTGEGRMLQLTGLTDDAGVLVAGVLVETPAGVVETDGGDRYVITSGGASPEFEGRTRLLPPSDDLPEVAYVRGEAGAPAEARLIAMLLAGEIDLAAMTEISSLEAVRESGGGLAVVAREPETPYGGLAVALKDADLARCLSAKLDYLTDERRIGFAQWAEDPGVFMRRAERWNAERRTIR